MGNWAGFRKFHVIKELFYTFIDRVERRNVLINSTFLMETDSKILS